MPGDEHDDGVRVHNEISGGRFHTVVQGHRVEVHFTSPRPEEQQARGRPGQALPAVVCAALGLALFHTPPPAARGLAPLGAALAVTGLVWCAAVLLELPERWRSRRAPRRGPLPEELDRVAADLAAALADEYARDERQSRIHDPVPIPVRWSAADPWVSDHEANILGAPATTDPPPAPAPDRDGRFDAIGRFFTSLPNGRLVILGAPGAGKSALALRLARALLDDRVSLTAVPVLLPLASWNPTEQDPWHWAAHRLAALHPSAVPTHHTAHDLITSGRLLPILDGLDELPAPTRARALARLRRSLNAPARLVLTCRSEEYEAAVADAATVLPAATVVQLTPLGIDDLRAYLPRTAPRTGPAPAAPTKWAPVLAELSADAGPPQAAMVRSVLSTPLMVSLARFVYSETHADPRDLLDNRRFPDAAAVERHLYDAFLSAAYEDSAARADSAGGLWSSAQARRWAGYLAAHLRRGGEQDIAWWRLTEAVPWWLRWPGTGLAVGVAALAVGLTGYDDPWWREWLPLPPWSAVLLLGSLAALLDCAPSPAVDAPRRLRVPGREEVRAWRRASRWLRWWLPAVVTALAFSGVFTRPGWALLPLALPALALLLSLSMGLLALLSCRADPAEASEPVALLRADRRTELVLGPLALVRHRRRRTATEVVLGFTFLLVIIWQVETATTTTLTWLRTAALVLLAWALCAWSGSAGGGLVLARLWFSFSGTLPWRVMTFLDDAHHRGVLRQSGGLYRFRHIELRNRLAEANGVTADGTAARPAREEPQPPSFVSVYAVSTCLMSMGLMASLMVSPDFTSKPAPTACELLPVKQVRQVIADPVQDDRGHLCHYEERSPFRPARKAMLDRDWEAPGQADEEEWDIMRRSMDTPGTFHLPRLGDEALLRVSPSTEPYGAPEAVVAVWAGHMIVRVTYSEEYATTGRVSAVARIIARWVLRAGDVPDDRIGAAGPVLADVPPAQLPRRTRTDGYQRPERSLYGAVWGADEHSVIQTHPDLSIPVRTPPDVFGCWPQEGDGVFGCSGESLVVNIVDRPAAQPPDPGPDPGPDLSYAVLDPEGSRYEISIRVTYTPAGLPAREIRVRVEADAGQAEVAQKIVNSVYTQTLPRG
ncbi:NACHT domain-containing protein [Streptomyces coeruleoprunus]|uniref:NACHT domain-containing protein n=1 Tax=Streptomyces coeruleoprunus TaxID=285563 RepID=A0ABV9X973_9ACTN